MAKGGPNIEIEQGGIDGGGINNILYFKDIIPSYKESDCVEQTNIEKLKELLLSWGFLNVVVSDVSLWKIATQYSDGPRLEWKGNLYVQTIGLHYLKCKNKDKASYQVCYDLYSSGYILLNTHASGYNNTDWKWIYISELGFGINVKSTYLWDDKNDILNKFSIPNQFVAAIGENELSKKEQFTSDIVDSYGDTVKYEYLNQIASYHTIPRYYIGNKAKSLKSISFDYNVKTSKIDGQFIFDDSIGYKGGNRKGAKYWSFYPQTYPIVVFNNMTDVDAHYVDINGRIGYYDKLNEHSFTYSNRKLKIDNTEVTVNDNDEVVFYIRKHGIWQAAQPNPAGKWSVTTNTVLELTSETNTATLTFEPIQIYKWEPKNTTFSFSCDVDEISKFITNITPKDYTKQIIQSKTNVDISLPILSGSSYDNAYAKTLFTYQRLFVSIGDYDFKTNSNGAVYDVKNVSHAEFKINTTVKNLQWISTKDIIPYYRQLTQISNIEVEDYKVDLYSSQYIAEVNATFYQTFQSLTGFFPKKIGYYGDMNNKEEDSGFLDPTIVSGTQVNGLQYYNSYYYNFIPPTTGSTSTGRMEKYRFKLYIGYKQWVDKDTFALAVVVWRNGKSAPSISTETISELHEIYESNGIQSGVTKTYSVQTNITAQDLDTLSVNVSSYEGFDSPTATLNSSEKINGKWKVTYSLTWNGGGAPSARVETRITCTRYM